MSNVINEISYIIGRVFYYKDGSSELITEDNNVFLQYTMFTILENKKDFRFFKHETGESCIIKRKYVKDFGKTQIETTFGKTIKKRVKK